MLKFIKSRFMGVKEPETKNEVHTNVIAPITQKLIDIRDDIYSIKFFLNNNLTAIYSDIIKDIKDPEFNNTLEELKVVSSEDIDLFGI